MATLFTPELLRAAENGDAPSQYAVGWYYERGLGVSKDLAEAEKWWKKAAAKGNVSALCALGNSAWWQKRPEEAARWWQRAAEAGDPVAQHSLGFFCDATLSLEERQNWTLKAAENGNAEAQNYLGMQNLWGNGDLIKRNSTLALKWFELASKVRPSFSSYILRIALKIFMTRQQITEAKKQAAEWMHRHGRSAP